ncbi:MAG TPA: 50S ribosomal protein L11 methyltransferase [Gaiellaceae bacterium]|jgi:ribosomal protein L11 methyltransferase|nr:50S ribosomal protein L11 methyltransferase [Gaiellaceae bacterium]
MLELFPQGFEELDGDGGVELVAYTDAGGEERLWKVFGGARGTDVEDGWEERWRSFHRPVRVGQLWIGPPWEEPDADAITVVIDPGRAFGTGSHPTTRLCLEHLAELPRGSVLDVGCGSGVLSIAAAKLGHGPVLGLDVEAAAIEATRENAKANGVEVEVEARLADGRTGRLPAADVTLANISLADVEQLEPDSEQVVTSGYLASERVRLPGYTHVARREADGWAADLHEREKV